RGGGTRRQRLGGQASKGDPHPHHTSARAGRQGGPAEPSAAVEQVAMRRWFHRASLASLLAFAAGASANSSAPPPGLRDVGIEQRLDQAVPLDLEFRDESDNQVKLGDFFGHKPVLLSFVYYRCPLLCRLALDGLVRSLRALSWNVGDEFEIVTVSIAEHETPAQAAETKRKIMASYGRDHAAAGWHFLAGEGDSGRRLAEAGGLHFRYHAAHDHGAHA